MTKKQESVAAKRKVGRKARPKAKRKAKVSRKGSGPTAWFAGPATSATESFAKLFRQIKSSLGSAGTTILDLNEDGRVDEKDVQIMAKRFRKAVDEVVSSEPVQSAIKAAAVGSVVAIPIPVFGPAGGAATAVVVYFAYRGAEGLVRAGGETIASAFAGRKRTKRAKVRQTSRKRGRSVAATTK